MKRTFVISLLFTLLAAGISSTAGAQATESRREQKRREREERRQYRRLQKNGISDVAVPVETTPAKKKFVTEYPQTTIKDRYRVHILVPMYLDELVKGRNVTFKNQIPGKAQPGMAFYQGVDMAADSLKKAGFKFDIYVHDVASAAESADALVTKGKLDSADLVIGAVPAKDIPVLAGLAATKHINFVSALSSADGGVAHNPYFTTLQPTLRSHCEWITTDVAQKYAGQKVILLHRRTQEADSNAWRFILESDGAKKVSLKKMSCATLPDRQKLLKHVDTTRSNVVIVSILDYAYADSILKVLSTSFPTTHFDVYGMPTWSDIANLTKKNTCTNLRVYVTGPFNFEQASPTARYINKTFKNDYGGKPGEMVYRGYETMFWYANLLKQFGTVFNDKYADNSKAPLTKFEVKPQWDKDGELQYQENKHLFRTTYEGGGFKTE